MKHWMKRLPLLIVLLLLLNIGAMAYGEQPGEEHSAQVSDTFFHALSQEDRLLVEPEAVPQAESGEKTAREYIIECLQNRVSSFSLYSYGVKTSEIKSLYQGVVTSNPWLFYATGGFRYNYYTNGRVTIVYPSYNTSKEELPERKAKFAAAVEQALAEIPKDVSDVEKVVAANNYIAYTARYSTSSSNAYGIFVDKAAHCQGYTRAFRLLMQELGVPCIQTGNSSHVWNMVQLDGEWYHVDVTWNDPTPNALGRVRNINLLRSDAVFKSNGHKSWSAGSPKAESTRYDSDAWWRNSWSQMKYHDGLWYFMTGRGANTRRRIWTYDAATDTAEELHNFAATWPSSGGAWIHNASMGIYDGKLYFNGAKGIYSIDLESEEWADKSLTAGRTPETFLLETLTGRERIYEMEVIGNRLRYRVRASLTGSIVREVVVLLTDDGGKAFEVNFDSGTGSVFVVPVPEGDTVSPPDEHPVRDGYMFLGWQLNGEDFDFSTPIKQGITLTAKWKEAADAPSPETISVYVGEAVQLRPSLELEEDIDLLWDSSDDSIASVDEDGLLYGLKAGAAAVQMKNTAGETLASFIVEVIERPLEEEGEGHPEHDPNDPNDTGDPAEPTVPDDPKKECFLLRIWRWICHVFDLLFGWMTK